MLILNDEGKWRIDNSFPCGGRTLADMVAHNSKYLHELCCMGHVTAEEIAIVDAALEERTRRMIIVSRVRRLIREAHRPLVRR